MTDHESYFSKRMKYLAAKFGMTKLDLANDLPSYRRQTLQELVDKQAEEAELGFIRCFASVPYKGEKVRLGYSLKL